MADTAATNVAHTPHLQRRLASSFDAQHPPQKEHIDDCVHCGFCLPACPTYVLWGEEMDSPRGRIYMIKKAAEGEAPLDSRFQTPHGQLPGLHGLHDGVPIGRGVQQTDRANARADRAQHSARPERADLSQADLRHFPASRPAAPSRAPLSPLSEKRACARWFVQRESESCCRRRLAAMEALLPEVPSHRFGRLPAIIPPQTPRRRVGMLSGCVQQVFFPHVNAATARVLAAEGLRGHHSPRSAMLRCADAPLRAGRPRPRSWRRR